MTIATLLCCDGPKIYHKIDLMTMSVNRAPKARTLSDYV